MEQQVRARRMAERKGREQVGADGSEETGAEGGLGDSPRSGDRGDGRRGEGSEGNGASGRGGKGKGEAAKGPGPREVAQQVLTAMATGLHYLMRACDGEVCLELLILLSDGERSVGMLARMLSLDLPSVSGRLSALREEGLVQLVRKEGTRRYYALSPQVRVGMRKDRRVIRIRATGGAELKLVLPLELMTQVSGGWPAVESDAPIVVRRIGVDTLMGKRRYVRNGRGRGVRGVAAGGRTRG